MISKRSPSDAKSEDRFSSSNVDRMSADAMTVRKLQPVKTNVGKRDQIIIPPFVASIYDHNLSEKLIDRRRKKVPNTKKSVSDFKPRSSKNGFVLFDSDDSSRPKLRFNVEDFRKKFNMKAVAMAELAFVRIAGKKVTVQTSKKIEYFTKRLSKVVKTSNVDYLLVNRL